MLTERTVLAMRKALTVDDVLKLMRTAQGKDSMRSFAASFGVTVAYISDIYAKRRDPGPSILDRLGLEKMASPKLYARKSETHHLSGIDKHLREG